MKLLPSLALLAMISFVSSDLLVAQNNVPASEREHLLMDFNWKFALGNASDIKADFDFGGAMGYLAKQNLGNPAVFGNFNDSKWRTVNLPHDWGMELPFNEKAESSWGSRPLGRPFPETSIGWYRKTFAIPASDKGRRISVEFEGVCHDCIVEVNGFLVGTHFSGYTSFSYDITDMIHFGGDNVVAVRVDATNNEGWWYQGAGIYRHVWLTKTAPVHVPQWGTQVLSKVNGNLAHITANTEVANDSPDAVDAVVQSSIVDDAGQTVATTASAPIHIEPWTQATATSLVEVSEPKLWSLETPTLYRLVTTVKSGDTETDRYETPFGIRTILFDPDKGFLLNGQPVRIKGFCDHEDHVIVGTAIPDSLYAWRLKKLKEELGGNAIRTSHNPPAPALLDACDRLGFLVMDEQRLFSSGEEGLKQLDSFVRRDRNHPSIIIWSAGNEEWGLQNSTASIPIMQRLQEEFHRLDPSRPVTVAASNGGDLNGLNSVAEVRGINYLGTFTSKSTPEAYHAAMPRQPVIGTEDGGSDPVKFMAANPWYSGAFIWTGYSYYGESKWPDVVGPFGAMDICGFPRQSGYDLFQKAWGGKNEEDPATGSTPSGIRLNCDRTTLNADGEDTAVVNITIVDDQNHRVGNANNLVTVQIAGPGKILGVGNGDWADHTLDQAPSHVAFQGRAQVLVQAAKSAGTIGLQVASNGLPSASLQISTEVGPQPASVP